MDQLENDLNPTGNQRLFLSEELSFNSRLLGVSSSKGKTQTELDSTAA